MDDIPIFSHEVREANCSGCAFERSPAVGSSGVWDSPIVIVGEFPGMPELKKGLPIAGPAGALLEQCWPEHLDYDLSNVFFINAVQCVIPQGVKKADNAEDILYSAVHNCRSRVLDLLSLAPRNFVLALGKWAVASIAGDPDIKITKIRGELAIYETAACVAYRVMPTINPNAILKGFGNVNHFKADLLRAMEIALGVGGKAYKHPRPMELPTAQDVRNVIAYIKGLRDYHECPIFLNVDIETTGFRFHTDRILCIGMYLDASQCDQDVGYVIDWDRIRLEICADPHVPSQLFLALKDLFELPTDTAYYVWHNGKFDVKFLRHIGIAARIDHDTFLMDYTLDERPGSHDLDEVAKNKIGAPNHKQEIKQWVPNKSDSYEKIPKPHLWQYLADDVKKTGAIFPLLHEEILADENNTKLYYQTLLPAAEMLSRVEARGICIDTFVRPIEYKDANGETQIHEGTFVSLNQMQYAEDMVKAQHLVSELAGYWVNPNSPAQVSDLLYDRLNLKIKGRRPAGTAKELLDKLPPHPVVKAIRHYRRLSKVLGTYINTVPKHMAPDGRIHSTYNLGGSRTGRLASSEPNVQNIPREGRIRRMYCAPPGRELTEGDYNTAELRMLAALSGDEFLTGVFMDDKRNLHDEVSVEMYGEDFTPDERIRAKAINFGIPYGRECYSIAAEFDIENSEAQRLIDAWFFKAPGAKAFLDKCRNAPTANQTLISAFGRKCRPGVVSYDLLKGMQNEFCNFFMQSTINDFGLHAAMELEYRLGKLDSFIVNLVHDSLLVENPPEARKEVVALMKYYMEEVPTRWIQTPIIFSVDFKHGQYWGLLKGK